jgi:hypothetical protein
MARRRSSAAGADACGPSKRVRGKHGRQREGVERMDEWCGQRESSPGRLDVHEGGGCDVAVDAQELQADA